MKKDDIVSLLERSLWPNKPVSWHKHVFDALCLKKENEGLITINKTKVKNKNNNTNMNKNKNKRSREQMVNWIIPEV